MPRIISLTFAFMLFLIAGIGSVSMAVGDNDLQQIHQWSEDDKKVIRSLSLSWLPLLPSDLSNAYADNPKAIALGKKLFFDKRFSANGKVSLPVIFRNISSLTNLHLQSRRAVQDPGRGALLLQEEFKQGSGASGADF